MKKRMCLVAMLCLVLCCSVNINASAKTKARWKIAYDNFFGKQCINWGGEKRKFSELKFAFIDVDKNGIPELILYNPSASSGNGSEWIYGYRNGRIVRLTKPFYHCEFAYDAKHKMFRMSGGKYDAFDDVYYVIKNSKAKVVASRTFYGSMTDNGKEKVEVVTYNKESWAKNVKKISKKKFLSLVKGENWSSNIYKNSKEKEFKYIWNKFKPVKRKYLNKYLGAPIKGKVVKIKEKTVLVKKNDSESYTGFYK